MVRMMMPAEPGGDSGHDKKGRQISVMFQYNPKRCFDEQIRSDQISRSVVSDSLRPQKSQHARPPCPSPTPGVR